MTTFQVNPNIGCKFPVTITTETQAYLARSLTTAIFLGANRHAVRHAKHRFLPAKPTGRDPQP